MIPVLERAWAAVAAPPFDVPVDPEAPEAQRWVIEELAKPEYQAAKPTWFDLLADRVWQWIQSLLDFSGFGGPPELGTAILAILVLAALVVAFLVFGLPRLGRRSRVTAELFGEDDERDARAMRSAAARAARVGDFALAIAEQYRAIARSLAERTIVTTTPGTTARGFADRAARAFPEFASELEESAAIFDDVRYLDGIGREADFERLVALDRALDAAKPAFPASAFAGAAL